MGSTNKTTNYELSQYIGTDKPSWLNDYNNDMLKIDTQMKTNATAAGNAQTTATAADGKADANTLAIETLNTQINTPSTGLAATVAGHTTDITSITGIIGNTPLTTTAQTLTGAIEEVKASVPSTSGLLQFTGSRSFTATGDGIKTYRELLNSVYSDLSTYVAARSSGYRFSIARMIVRTNLICSNPGAEIISSMPTVIGGRSLLLSQTGINAHAAEINLASSQYESYTSGTYADNSLTAPASGTSVGVVINEYMIN